MARAGGPLLSFDKCAEQISTEKTHGGVILTFLPKMHMLGYLRSMLVRGDWESVLLCTMSESDVVKWLDVHKPVRESDFTKQGPTEEKDKSETTALVRKLKALAIGNAASSTLLVSHRNSAATETKNQEDSSNPHFGSTN